MKRWVYVLLVLTLLFTVTACGDKKAEGSLAFEAFTEAIDIEFTKEVTSTISQFGDDPATGNRSAGSPAEKETADYLFDVMKEVGLTNVAMEDFTCDGWTYKGANVTFTDAQGASYTTDLGGYATHMIASNEKVPLVYLGEGTMFDLEDDNGDPIDVEGKLILIDIDQDNNWWITYPQVQAHLRGAKGVIAMSQFPGEDETGQRIGSQDICGPAPAPAYGICQKDSTALQEAISAKGTGEIEVIFNSNSVVTENDSSQIVWGEIPGVTDEVIYMIGHYDGYYHSYYDDASGIATVLGIAKAMVESGYTPDKTIRVIATGAEEWGAIDTAYDWAVGGWAVMTQLHPDWPKNAFAVVNIDGGYPLEGELGYAIACSHELATFAEESYGSVKDLSELECWVESPGNTYTEDFGWTRLGIPSIIASHSDPGIYYDMGYHTSYDNPVIMPLSEDSLLFNHILFGKIVLDLDSLAVRPMNFASRFEAMMDSYDSDIIDNPQLMSELDIAIESSKALTEKINSLNFEYFTALNSGDKASASKIRTEAIAFNKSLYELFVEVQDKYLALDWNLNVMFPHEVHMWNVASLSSAIENLKAGDVVTAMDDDLSAIDFAWYAMVFDKETCDYVVDQGYFNSFGTWGENMVREDICYVDDVVRSLLPKYDISGADVTSEIKELEKLLAKEQLILQRTLNDEATALLDIRARIDQLAK